MGSRNMSVVIDAHLHLWELKRFQYKWPRPVEESHIYRDYTAGAYERER